MHIKYGALFVEVISGFSCYMYKTIGKIRKTVFLQRCLPYVKSLLSMLS